MDEEQVVQVHDDTRVLCSLLLVKQGFLKIPELDDFRLGSGTDPMCTKFSCHLNGVHKESKWKKMKSFTPLARHVDATWMACGRLVDGTWTPAKFCAHRMILKIPVSSNQFV